MKLRGVIVLLLLATLTTTTIASTTDVDEQRAAQYLANKEWEIARTRYDKLLQEHPLRTDFYAAAITASLCYDSLTNVMPYVTLSQKSGLSLDTLLITSAIYSRKVEQPTLYPRLLHQIKSEQPWFANLINRYLLNFYLFRKEYKTALLYADALAETLPNSLEIKKAKATALLGLDQIDVALNCYRVILDEYPDDRDALLYLGVYYYQKSGADDIEIRKAFLNRRKQLQDKNIPSPTIFDNEQEKIIEHALDYMERLNANYANPQIQKMLLQLYIKKEMWGEATQLRAKLRTRPL